MIKVKSNTILTIAQIIIWIGIIILPATLSWLVGGQADHAREILRATVLVVLPLFILYCINFFWLAKYLLVKEKKHLYYIGNLLLLLLLNLRFLHPRPIPPEVMESIPFAPREVWAFVAVGAFFSLLIQIIFIIIATSLRMIVHSNNEQMKMREEKQKNAEAELTWLKSQLNPHFLFNTLNNISSLTQIDPDKAQESIGQLSDLLRYALYESNDELVPLSGEVEFMKNYIELMQLRCNEMTEVRTSFDVPPGDAKIAPLIFISLIENAFKHGVNARHPSFVEVRMETSGNNLEFKCRNSVFEKSGSDHIGSGIGLENMVRRLELIYPGKYAYEHSADDTSYTATVTLKDMF